MKNNGKSIIIVLVVLALMVVSVSALFAGSGIKNLSYSEVLTMFREGQVVEFVVNKNNVL